MGNGIIAKNLKVILLLISGNHTSYLAQVFSEYCNILF